MKIIRRIHNQSKQINSKDWLAISFSRLGSIYNSLGDYSNAMINFNYSLEINKKLKNKCLSMNLLIDIGINAYFIGDFEKAINYHKKALKIRDELGYKNIQCLTNIGRIYFDKGESGKVSNYYFKAINNKYETGDREISSPLWGLGLISLDKKEYVKAIDYLNKANTIKTQLKLSSLNILLNKK